jgi:hypothetical protein
VKHVRGSMLLLEVAAALVGQPGACKMLQDVQAQTSLVTGVCALVFAAETGTSGTASVWCAQLWGCMLTAGAATY